MTHNDFCIPIRSSVLCCALVLGLTVPGVALGQDGGEQPPTPAPAEPVQPPAPADTPAPPQPGAAPAPPGGSLNDPWGHVFRVFYDGVCDLAEKPSHLSSEMAICGSAGAYLSKNGRPSRAKCMRRKNMHPLCARIVIFAPTASKKVVPCERGEVEGRFAS